MRDYSPLLKTAALTAAIALCLGLSGCNQGKQGTPAATPAKADAAADTKQGVFEFTGKVPELKDGTTVELFLAGDAAIGGGKPAPVARTEIKRGSFTLTGSVKRAEDAVVVFGGDDHMSIPFILENAKQTMEMTSLGPTVRGGAIHDKVYGYLWDPAYVAAAVENERISKEAFKNVDTENEAAMNAARKKSEPALSKMLDLRDTYHEKVLAGNAPAAAKLFVLMAGGGNGLSDASRNSVLADIKSELGPDDVRYVRFMQLIQMDEDAKKTKTTLTVGSTYKPIEAVDIDGKTVKLADVVAKNKIVMVDFWASWCGPCRGEFPHLEKVYKEFHSKGFEIYAISLDAERSAWVKALKEEKAKGDIPWINLVDTQAYDSVPAKTYGIQGLPDNYLISSDGKIIGRGLREWDIEREVRAVFKAPSAEKSK